MQQKQLNTPDDSVEQVTFWQEIISFNINKLINSYL